MKKYVPLLSLSITGLLNITLQGMHTNNPQQQHHNLEKPIKTAAELLLEQKKLIRIQLQKKSRSSSSSSHSWEHYNYGYVVSTSQSSDGHSDSDNWSDWSQ